MFGLSRREKNLKKILMVNNQILSEEFSKALHNIRELCDYGDTFQDGLNFVSQLSDIGYIDATEFLSNIYYNSYDRFPVKRNPDMGFFYRRKLLEQHIKSGSSEEEIFNLKRRMFGSARHCNEECDAEICIDVLKQTWEKYKDYLNSKIRLLDDTSVKVSKARKDDYVYCIDSILVIKSINRIDYKEFDDFDVFYNLLSVLNKFRHKGYVEIDKIVEELNSILDMNSILPILSSNPMPTGPEFYKPKMYKDGGRWYGMKEYDSYQEYLQSDIWKAIKKIILQRDSYTCQVCSSRATQVHHRLYPEIWGFEVPDILISVCNRCHHDFHHLQKAMSI